MRIFLVLIVMMMSSAFVMAQDNYGFKVGGVDVTSDNYLDLTEINGVSGKVYFDPNTRTLTLDNATIERNSTDGTGIVNKTVSDFTVKLIGRQKAAAADLSHSSATSSSTTAPSHSPSVRSSTPTKRR